MTNGTDIETPAFLAGPTEPAVKRRVLSAALRLFVRDGLDATGIRDIAAAAGCTNPALYRHFEGKEALALHLFERAYAELLQRLEGAVDALPPPESAAEAEARTAFAARLRAFLQAFLAWYDAQPEAVLYVSEHLQRFWPHVREPLRRRTVITLVRGLLREGVAAGAVGTPTLEAVRLVAIVGTLSQLTRMVYLAALPGPALRWLDDVEALVRRMLV